MDDKTPTHRHPLDLANCPECGNAMHLFSSYRQKVCSFCGATYDWELKEKQQPLVKHQR